MSINITFLGLGVMGYPMAGHLVKAGHNVTVYNRTAAKADAWVAQFGGSSAETPKTAVADADIICMCLGNDDDVRSVVYGANGILAGASESALVIDHTTASEELAKELGLAFSKQSVGFIDAPVSGGQAGAQNGMLTVMCGGQPSDFAKAEPALSAYAKQFQLIGAVGAGQLAKMMNQICIAGIVQGLAEALHFGEKAGLDRNKVVDVISQGAAQSWQMDNRAKTMIDGQYDFGFAVDWMRKDLGIALDAARTNGATLALTALVDQYYADIQKMSGGRQDTSSLLRRLR
ncbi:NAD(P)-dependent oxidoreductase [Opacimonas viscosa]|uniref:NAD(P)-dependent oxidoreductase n=1 Tax=Opacimonas viscosa TaxID=2961944 RepID=A0AA41WVY6_9ALTE|nr:NAD(P)-dependent oxidoreductase [Opacimonas viscosa]MCP3427579.1 NAD(P)-dependent oxidoreductase [Opacimonas viscosa]